MVSVTVPITVLLFFGIAVTGQEYDDMVVPEVDDPTNCTSEINCEYVDLSGGTIEDSTTPSGTEQINLDNFVQDNVECDIAAGITNATYGCCAINSSLPAHGPNQVGCCASTEFGCCPDNKSPANGKSFNIVRSVERC